MSTEFLVRYFPLCRSRCFLSVRSFYGRECFRHIRQGGRSAAELPATTHAPAIGVAARLPSYRSIRRGCSIVNARVRARVVDPCSEVPVSAWYRIHFK